LLCNVLMPVPTLRDANVLMGRIWLFASRRIGTKIGVMESSEAQGMPCAYMVPNFRVLQSLFVQNGGFVRYIYLLTLNVLLRRGGANKALAH